MLSYHPKTNFDCSVTCIFSSANAFNFENGQVWKCVVWKRVLSSTKTIADPSQPAQPAQTNIGQYPLPVANFRHAVGLLCLQTKLIVSLIWFYGSTNKWSLTWYSALRYRTLKIRYIIVYLGYFRCTKGNHSHYFRFKFTLRNRNSESGVP